jgi:hypothetical protein
MDGLNGSDYLEDGGCKCSDNIKIDNRELGSEVEDSTGLGDSWVCPVVNKAMEVEIP